MPDQNLEMPDGNIRTYNAQSLKDLKRRVAETLGVDEDEVAVLNDSGHPVPESGTPPSRGKVVPKPVWGGNINEYQLSQDLINAQYARGYNSLFYIRLISAGLINPFRTYLYFQNKWWPIEINLNSYPIYSNPTTTFEQLIPPCPVHSESWHPNVYDNRKVCWGDVSLLPETRIIGLLNLLHGLLHSPNHNSVVAGRCK